MEQTPSYKGYLFDPRTGYIFLLNPTGLYIAKLVQKYLMTAEEIVDWLENNLEVMQSAAVREEVGQFLTRLADYNLLTEE